MAKRRDKKILKMLKRRSAPKRIAGVKVPKALRRAAETELGAAVIASVMVGSAGALLQTPYARDLRRRTQLFAEKLAASIGDTVDDIRHPDHPETELDNVRADRRRRRREEREAEAVTH